MDKVNSTQHSVDNSAKNRPIRLEDLRITDRNELTIPKTRVRLSVEDEYTACGYEHSDVSFEIKVSNKVLVSLVEKIGKQWLK